jgi:pimeloyl-ACP methyl ester carboxylesterase
MLIVAAIILVALFRSACLGGSAEPLNLWRQLISGLWLGIAGWVAGAVLQAWVPIWLMLLVGVALTATAALVRPRFSVLARATADFLTIMLVGLLSIVPVRLELVIAAALAFALGGFTADRITRLLGPRLQLLLQTMPAVALVLLALQVRQPGNFGSRLLAEDRLFPLRLILAAPAPGARLPLDPGVAAWLLAMPNGDSRGTAVVLHGNHRLGSRQPSAVALQGALLRAGYDVLSVDHPGFGSSRTPLATAEWRAWDPALGPLRDLQYLQHTKREHPSETIVVGHSMGVDVALKLVSDGAPVQAAYLWGGSLDRPNGPNWLSGFHRERHLPCCLPEPTMQKIRDEFYGGGDRFAARLPENHAPVHFVRFGIEHADVMQVRDLLYDAIPQPKETCDFDSVSHYFNSLSVRRFVLLDALTIRRMAEIFADGDEADEICN